MTKRKAAEEFLDETRQGIEAVHGPKALPALLNLEENTKQAACDPSKPVLPVNVQVTVKDQNGVPKCHRMPLVWRPSDPAYKPYAAAYKLVQEIYPCDPNNKHDLALRLPLEATIDKQIQSTIVRHPYIENANVQPRTIKLHVVLSPHLELHDTLTWTPLTTTPMQYATQVAQELGLPWVCTKRIAHALSAALNDVKTEGENDAMGAPTSTQGPSLVRIPRPQPLCPPAVHIQAPTQRDLRPGSMLGGARTAAVGGQGGGAGMVGFVNLGGSLQQPQQQQQQHNGQQQTGSGTQPLASDVTKTTQAGPIGSWAAAASQPERPQSQATGLSGPSSVGLPLSTDAAAAGKVEDTAVGGVAVGGAGPGVAPSIGLGISFKLGGGTGVKAQAPPAPAPKLLAGLGDDDDDNDEEDDE